MPYANDFCGIYRIVNLATNECYVGQSQWMKKRIREHFRLLRLKKHPNPKLQNSFNKYGESSFLGIPEVVVDDFCDLDALENDFISGNAKFDTPVVYNVANFAKAPMRGRFHSEATRCKIREAVKRRSFDYNSESWRAALRAGQLRRFTDDKEFVEKVKYILSNSHLSYAERARQINSDTSSVRKLYLKYKDKKDIFK